jgi:hypothetical protein
MEAAPMRCVLHRSSAQVEVFFVTSFGVFLESKKISK